MDLRLELGEELGRILEEFLKAREKELKGKVGVTDLLRCPRFKRPPEPSGAVLRGVLFHEGLAAAARTVGGCSVEDERSADVDGFTVCFKPDLVADGAVYEFKTVRKLHGGRAYEHHLAQACIYAALLNADRAVLVYYVASEDRFAVFKAALTGEDRKKAMELLRRRAEAYRLGARSPMWEWECRLCQDAACPNKKQLKAEDEKQLKEDCAEP